MAVQEEEKVLGAAGQAGANTTANSGASASKPMYKIDYNDPRFTKWDAEKEQTTNEFQQMYGNMIADTDGYYQDLKDATQQWADTQSQLQQDRTDFTIEQIEQQKDQAHKDYVKEQSGAYVDWRKQSNQYGTEAEKMASAGLAGTGFSESSQVIMYNTYQNRIATARESYQNAVLNYNNAIKDAQLQNNAALAEIAYQSLQKQLELSLEGFQYKNQLVLDMADKKLEIDQMYYNRWQDTLQQINTENALAEDIRQFNENLKFQADESQKQRDWQTGESQKDRDWQSVEKQLDRDFEAAQNKIKMDFEAKQAELTRKHDKEMLAAKTKAEKEILAQQHKNDMAKLAQQQRNALAQIEKEYKEKRATAKYEADLKKQNTIKIKDDVKIKDDKTFSRYSDATAYMKSKGVSGTAISGLMTATEWSGRKNSGSTYSGVKNNDTYADYLTEYVAYQVATAPKVFGK